METKFCTNCGQKLTVDAKFCPNCGTAQPPVSSTDSSTHHERQATTDEFEHTNATTNPQQVFHDVPYNESTPPNLISSTGRYFKDAFNLHKRMGRADYWWASLGISLIAIVIGIVYVSVFAASLGTMDDLTGFDGLLLIILAIYWLFITIAGFTAQFRRFHDIGYSGAFWLINFVPFVGSIAVLIMLCQPSRQFNNRYID
ncbi:DUF805 domain-containing protein [Lactiplantibacillus songbeiensis]|uniref:DUF805 domain-containing protein n=1 Tax=Lactiplantibacillus songbeiensis TaxID=2559920 RepID=A0ABW4C5I6_9LACO|nr:DUF805 domain-containing protein [Lactiplantibacillus songbeiensis]